MTTSAERQLQVDIKIRKQSQRAIMAHIAQHYTDALRAPMDSEVRFFTGECREVQDCIDYGLRQLVPDMPLTDKGKLAPKVKKDKRRLDSLRRRLAMWTKRLCKFDTELDGYNSMLKQLETQLLNMNARLVEYRVARGAAVQS